jgi:hypothetical protein
VRRPGAGWLPPQQTARRRPRGCGKNVRTRRGDRSLRGRSRPGHDRASGVGCTAWLGRRVDCSFMRDYPLQSRESSKCCNEIVVITQSKLFTTLPMRLWLSTLFELDHSTRSAMRSCVRIASGFSCLLFYVRCHSPSRGELSYQCREKEAKGVMSSPTARRSVAANALHQTTSKNQ